MSEKSKSNLKAENAILKRQLITDRIASAITTAIKWSGLVLIARYIYLTIAILAGKATLINVLINVLSHNYLTVTTPWAMTICIGVYGYKQRKLRKDTTERLQGHIKHLELELDNKRSSSMLTTRGNTSPEDI